MDDFFKKFPVKHTDVLAMDMIYDTVKESKEKHREKDKSYVEDLYLAHQMIEAYLNEKGYKTF